MSNINNQSTINAGVGNSHFTLVECDTGISILKINVCNSQKAKNKSILSSYLTPCFMTIIHSLLLDRSGICMVIIFILDKNGNKLNALQLMSGYWK